MNVVTKTIQLTRSQLSAVEIYVTDPVHDDEHGTTFRLTGSKLEISGDLNAAIDLLTEAANSADVDGVGVVALTNLIRKARS